MVNSHQPDADTGGPEPGGGHNLQLDNSGNGKLLVPGFGDVPLLYELPATARFAHGFGDWSQHRLTAREIAMLRLMNSITDKPQWYLHTHDLAVTAEWAREAMDIPLISEAAWDWCLAELRDKAELYKSAGFTHVLDSASRLCKSDTLIPTALVERIAAEVDELAARENGELIDPDLFPLKFVETPVLVEGGAVGCDDAIDRVCEGEPSPRENWDHAMKDRCTGCPSVKPIQGAVCTRCRQLWTVEPDARKRRGLKFSTQYQWLPAEVEFIPTSEGSAKKIRITSYINNLHPNQHKSLYDSIERCIEASIQPWNEVLVWKDRGRTPERVRTYGVQWDPEPPSWHEMKGFEETMRSGSRQQYLDTKAQLREFLQLPENPLAPPRPLMFSLIDEEWAERWGVARAMRNKFDRLKRWLHPEPGVSFTYDEWRRGKNNRPVVPKRTFGDRMGGQRPDKDDHEFYAISLERMFADKGLQVVVEVGAVELTPEDPTVCATKWQLSALPNEHIVATTVMYFGSDNMSQTSGDLSFQVEADLDPLEHVWGTETGSDPHHALTPLADIYGLGSHWDLSNDDTRNGPAKPALQVLGTISMPDGRLVTFPNVMQHRTEACSLLDRSRPGRRRYMKLHLVDPHYRICSTRNAPPQQPHWWTEAVFERIDWGRRGILPEVVDIIRTFSGQSPALDMKTARGRRGALGSGRLWYHEQTFVTEVAQYQFGEDAAIGEKYPCGYHGWAAYERRNRQVR